MNNIINKKNYYKILNNYKVIEDEYSDVFKINIYYLEDNLCKINIRRLDKNTGWGKDLKIIIYSYDDKDSEILSIGSSELNDKIMEFYTDIKLEKDIVDIKNTYNIIQVNNKSTLDNYYEYLNYENIIDNNFNMNYILFSEKEQRIFIKNNCYDYLHIYDILIDTNLRNMIFICNYLYLNGGYYINTNINFYKSLDNYNIEKINYVYNNNIFEIIFSREKNIILLNYLNNIINNNYDNIIENELEIDKNDYSITFQKYIKNNEVYKFTFEINNYKFIVLNNDEYTYNIEYANLNYYLLTTDNINNSIITVKYIDINDDINIIELKINNNKCVFKI